MDLIAIVGRLSMVMALVSVLVVPLGAQAAGTGGTSNDMLRGGCTTKADCAEGVRAHRELFSGHGVSVSSADIKSQDTVKGSVTKSGNVMVDGKVVATGAMSFGRENLSGSTKSGSVFKRPTSVSFQSSPLEAWVFMPNGRFQYAILTSCGNLVMATPKVVAKAQPKPVQQPVQAAAPVINVTQEQHQTQTQTQPQAPAPAPQPVVAAAPLPATGAGLTASLFGLSALLVASWYYFRSRRGLALAWRRS